MGGDVIKLMGCRRRSGALETRSMLFHHHGFPVLQRFPTAFARSFRTSPRSWLPRSSVNITTNSTPETPRFRDELVRSISPKSFSDHVRYPGIRNQILVRRTWGFGSELVVC